MSALQIEEIFLNICSDILCKPLNLDMLGQTKPTDENLKLMVTRLNFRLNTKYSTNDFDKHQDNLLSILSIIKRDLVVYSD